MSQNAHPIDDQNATDWTEEPLAADGAGEEEYEEICSDEVDRVVQALEELMSTVDSENVRAYLEEAADNIFSLVYGDDGVLEGDSSSELLEGSVDDLAA